MVFGNEVPIVYKYVVVEFKSGVVIKQPDIGTLLPAVVKCVVVDLAIAHNTPVLILPYSKRPSVDYPVVQADVIPHCVFFPGFAA